MKIYKEVNSAITFFEVIKVRFAFFTVAYLIVLGLSIATEARASTNKSTTGINNEDAASLPRAENVSISGVFAAGETLTASYDYFDSDGDPESSSKFQWYRSESNGEGAFKEPILGADEVVLVLQESHIGAYISFEVIPRNAFEEGEPVSTALLGPVQGYFDDGDGSQENPYQIANARHLNNIRYDMFAYYELVSDIDLTFETGDSLGKYWNDGIGWQPIGTSFENSFQGVLHGGNYEIYGLYINNNQSSYTGLFGYIYTGKIYNLGLENVHVISDNSNTGGIAGILHEGRIFESYVSGSIEGRSNTGGLVGTNRGWINESSSTGTVTGHNFVGGLAGVNYLNDGSIDNSYSRSNVDGFQNIGGLVGTNQNNASIAKSYSTGTVSGSSGIGGLVSNTGGSVTNSFWDIESSGIANSGGGIGKTTAQMKVEATFTDAGWNFFSDWYINGTDNDGYPNLWELEPNEKPIASDVSISGFLAVGNQLTGSYFYQDPDGEELEFVDNEKSKYQWYRADNASGDDKSAIEAATSLTYTTTSNDLNKYIIFEVSPYDGDDLGDPVESEAVGPVSSSLFAGGAGTKTDPWLVSTAQELNHIRADLFGYYLLTADIDLTTATGDPAGEFWNDGKGWDPIGSDTETFSGIIDGGNHTITGLYINRSENFVGFVARTDTGRVINLGLLKIDITALNSVGGLVGQNMGTIENSFVSGKLEGGHNIGLLVGQNYLGEIYNCYSMGSITGYGHQIGGLVGSNDQSGAVISYSYSTANVSGTAINLATNRGGLAGLNTNSATIINSYSTGTVTGSGGGNGGFVGQVSSGATVSGSYWNTETSELTNGTGTGSATGFAGLTSSQMLSSANFPGWDFENTWKIYERFSFPFLRNVGNQLTSGLVLSGSEGWRMMSAPFPGLTYGKLLDALWTQGFDGADYEEGSSNVYIWDETNRQFETITSADDVIPNGTGILVYVFDDQDYDGAPDAFSPTLYLDSLQNFANVSPSLSYTLNAAVDSIGWNLLGNPYGATIDWDAASGWTRSNLDETFYVWSDSANSGTGAYLTWNGDTGTLPSGLIAPWQGFWVKANAAEPSITFTDEVRSTGGIFFKSADAPTPQIRFALEGDQKSSETILMLSEQASTGKDALDAYKLQSLNTDYLSLFSTLENGAALDINALPAEMQEPLEIALDFNGSNPAGEYELNWNIEAFPEDWSLKLTDHVTGAEINLNELSTYSFEVNAVQSSRATAVQTQDPAAPQRGLASPRHGIVAPKVIRAKSTDGTGPRFTVTITSAQAVSNEPGNALPTTFGLAQNYPNPFNPSTVIRYQLPVNSEVQLEVFDIMGRKVATLVDGERKSAGMYKVTFDAAHLASGMYIYRLQAGNKTFTKKLTLIK